MGIALMVLVLVGALGAWSVFLFRQLSAGRAETTALVGVLTEADAQRTAAVATVSRAVTQVDTTLSSLASALETGVGQLRQLDATVADQPAPRIPRVRPGPTARVVNLASAPVPAGQATYTLDMMFVPRDAAGAAQASRTLGLSTEHPVSFIVPTLATGRMPGTSARSVVASEDMLAAKAVGHVLLRGWPDAQVSTRTVDPGGPPGDLHGNIVTFCRDERNPVTDALLRHPKVQAAFGISFPKIPSAFLPHAEEVAIVFDGEPPRRSLSYAQEWQISDTDDAVELEDLALLARFENPFDPGAKVLVLAGVRAFGTLGAAEFLRLQSSILLDETGDSDFAALIKVVANYQVSRNPDAEIKMDELAFDLVPVGYPSSIALDLVPVGGAPASVELIAKLVA